MPLSQNGTVPQPVTQALSLRQLRTVYLNKVSDKGGIIEKYGDYGDYGGFLLYLLMVITVIMVV